MAATYAYLRAFIFTWDKAARELGYAPGPFEPAIAEALTWLRQNGML